MQNRHLNTFVKVKNLKVNTNKQNHISNMPAMIGEAFDSGQRINFF